MTKPVIQLKVSGSAPFPFDMLRYDACAPRSTEDAHMIRDLADLSLESAWTRGMRGPLPKRATIRLNCFAIKPTPARWESFGWECVVVGEDGLPATVKKLSLRKER